MSAYSEFQHQMPEKKLSKPYAGEPKFGFEQIAELPIDVMKASRHAFTKVIDAVTEHIVG